MNLIIFWNRVNTGFLCKDEMEICDRLESVFKNSNIEISRKRVRQKFMWKESAKVFTDIINLLN